MVLAIGHRVRATTALEFDVPARLLLHQQPTVGGHQVDTSLQSKSFTDERRFEDRLLFLILLEQDIDHFFQVVHLLTGIVEELLGVEARTGTELKRLLLERVHDSGVHRHLLVVDHIVKGTARKVS